MSSLIKIDEEVLTGAVSAVVLSGMSSDYDVYMVTIVRLEVETNQKDIKMRFTEGGTVNETANYETVATQLNSNQAFNDSRHNGETSIDLSLNIGNDTGEQFNSTQYIFNSQTASEYTFCTIENAMMSDAGELRGKQASGIFQVASVVDGVRYSSNSNMDNGIFTLYGLKS